MNFLQKAAQRLLGLQAIGPATREDIPPEETPVASGTKIYGGKFEYEYNRKLNTSERWETFDEMEADGTVKTTLRQDVLPLITSEWLFEPASKKRADVEFANLCNANILNMPNEQFGPRFVQESPWKAQRLPETLRMLRDGFSMFVCTPHTITDDRGKTRRVYRRQQWVEPISLYESGSHWDIDGQDNILGVRRSYTAPDGTHKYEYIPASRLKLYVWELLGARYEGRPTIRSMYGAWFRKDFMVKRQLLWVQKVGAPSPIGTYPKSANWSKDQVAAFETYVRATTGRNADKSYFVGPVGDDGVRPEINFAGSEHPQIDRMGSVVDRENTEILRTGNAASQGLGEGGTTGNRAVGEVKGRREVLETRAIAEVLVTWMFYGALNLEGEVQELASWNYAPGSLTGMPKLTYSKFDPFAGMREQREFLDGYRIGLVPRTAEVRRQFTERHGYQLPETAYEEDIEPLASGPPGPGGPNIGGDSPGDDPREPNRTPGERPSGTTPNSQLSLESIEQAKARVASLLEPVEDAPPPGGTFR